MAKTNNNSPRQTHVSPGIYTKETDLTYAAKSLGITTLGVVGETVKGPAFQPILCDSWRTFQTYFGGTNTTKFKGTNYPKYELPYIAKSYLQESEQLQVVRVLGLSGTNAGTAWILAATGEGYSSDSPLVIGVLRSRGEHRKAAFIEPANGVDVCEDRYEYDKLVYFAEDVKVIPSKTLALSDGCTPGYTPDTVNGGKFPMSVTDYGTFTLKVNTVYGDEKYYSVTLNPSDKNYILNVLGTKPDNGDAEIYVEELYDVAIKQLIEKGLIDELAFNGKNEESDEFNLYTYEDIKIVPKHKPVYDLLVEDESMLTRKYVGRRYLYSDEESKNNETGEQLRVHISSDKGKSWVATTGIPGHIYTVIPFTTKDGTREYYYGEYVGEQVQLDDDVLKALEKHNKVNNDEETLDNNGVFAYSDISLVAEELEYFGYNDLFYKSSTEKNYETEYLKNCNVITKYELGTSKEFGEAVEVLTDGMYYINRNTEIKPVTLDLNNYRSEYRYASTPWIVSEIKGDAENVTLNRLFRFHTISDGNTSNTEVKVSIQNIDPDNGVFDVVVRSFYDTDGSPVILERYNKCDLVRGSDHFIGLMIGTTDEEFETRSNYITVEVNETDETRYSIPAGFLGYPVRDFEEGTAVSVASAPTPPSLSKPYIQYNTNVNEDIRITKQYFGISDLVGVDEDILRYKGVEAYNEMPDGLSPCFHLDSRILEDAEKTTGLKQTVTVDGVVYDNWVTVGKANITEFGIEPRIGKEEVMLNTIYEDKRYRKFTVAFYGGWDGWDYYRSSRSNGDEFTYNKYRGNLNRNSGEGVSFSVLRNPETYGFDDDTRALTSDYYAYLSGIRQFANPKQIDINVLATPGIDYVNNKMLVEDTIAMVEEERADSVYVVTTPDKPAGAGDGVTEMYTAVDAAGNLEDSDIDSNYTCTYYPWVKYYDQDNSQYIYLPVTKDIVRNFAFTDNKTYPWFAAAGWNRGTIDGVRSKKNLKLAEQDTLYENRINFINTFPDEGLKIWGDKNLQVKDSQMNRISKRRLLLRIRKLLSIACIGLLFDPNDNSIVQSFKSAVNPILQDIVSKRGLTDFRIEVDDSQEARDRLELPATIYLKLQPNLEYITINFVITPSGVSFDNV